jgi:hypothetical protein
MQLEQQRPALQLCIHIQQHTRPYTYHYFTCTQSHTTSILLDYFSLLLLSVAATAACGVMAPAPMQGTCSNAAHTYVTNAQLQGHLCTHSAVTDEPTSSSAKLTACMHMRPHCRVHTSFKQLHSSASQAHVPFPRQHQCCRHAAHPQVPLHCPPAHLDGCATKDLQRSPTLLLLVEVVLSVGTELLPALLVCCCCSCN